MSVEIHGLTVQRGTFRLEIPALEIRTGEIVGLGGPSGCGKSTLLLAIAGLVEARGEIRLGGRAVISLPPECRDVALVFQDGALFSHLTVEENVAFGLRVRKLKAAVIQERVDDILQDMELTPFRSQLTSQLSGGQAQRVALARALVLNVPVALLDEPFNSLDEALKQRIRARVFDRLVRNHATALVVSHEDDPGVSRWIRLGEPSPS